MRRMVYSLACASAAASCVPTGVSRQQVHVFVPAQENEASSSLMVMDEYQDCVKKLSAQLLGGTASSTGVNGKVKIGVLTLDDATNVGSDLTKALAESLTGELERSKKFILVESVKLEKVYQELRRQEEQRDALEPSTRVELGKQLGLAAIVIGSLTKVGDHFNVTCRLVDVGTGSIVSAASAMIPMRGYANVVPPFVTIRTVDQEFNVFDDSGRKGFRTKVMCKASYAYARNVEVAITVTFPDGKPLVDLDGNYAVRGIVGAIDNYRPSGNADNFTFTAFIPYQQLHLPDAPGRHELLCKTRVFIDGAESASADPVTFWVE